MPIRHIADLLFRSPGRPSRKPLVRYKSFHYRVDSWTTARRVGAKVEHHVGELFPRVGFIVTNRPLPNRAVVRFYNKGGTAEQWIKQGKQAAHWTRLSCHRFRANEVRLQLSVLAYNLGNLWRRLGRPTRIARWSVTSLQQRLVKTGGRFVKHACYYWLLPVESHLTRRLSGRCCGGSGRCSCRPVDGRPLAGGHPAKQRSKSGRVSRECTEMASLPVSSRPEVFRGADFEGEKNATKYSRGTLVPRSIIGLITGGQNGNPGLGFGSRHPADNVWCRDPQRETRTESNPCCHIGNGSSASVSYWLSCSPRV